MSTLTLTPGAVTLDHLAQIYWSEAPVRLDPACRPRTRWEVQFARPPARAIHSAAALLRTETAPPPEVRIGESGAIYFAVNGLHYGPAGPRGAVSTVALSVDALTADYAVADLDADAALAEAVRVAEVTLPVAAEAAPTED